MRSNAGQLWTVLIACLGGIGLLCAPAAVTVAVQTAVRDLMRPGQSAWQDMCRVVREQIPMAGASRAKVEEWQALRAELEASRVRERQLLIGLARLKREVSQAVLEELESVAPERRESLLAADLVDAAVLGAESAALWRGRRLLDAGQGAGIEESAQVLSDLKPLIDQGQDSRLATGQPVYSGRIVVGKIAAAGRWSSTLQLVTDAGYRGVSRLLRRGAHGAIFGAEGILEGEGQELCRLKFVAATEPVSVGDEVFTGGTDGALPYPRYYGRVVQAELPEGASHWSILVRPALADVSLERVQVLRTRVNAVRLLAH